MNLRTKIVLPSLPTAARGLATALVGALALTLGSCGGEADDHGDGGHNHDHSDFVFVVWPESGSTVFSKTPIYIGSPAKKDHVHGQVVLLPNVDAPAVGSAKPEGTPRLAPGSVVGPVELPPGKHTIHVVLYDEDGKATDMRQTVEYTVEATPENLGVEWLEPKDGATVKSPFKVRFGATGVDVVPAGESPLDKTVGHHHITINKGSMTPGLTVPAGDMASYMHYGKGQTEAEVDLPAGTHKLTMQFGDAAHRSYGPMLSQTITVTVE